MSRFKRYAHSLASGYVLLAVNVLYTLATVPLALHFLTKEQFGLWALVSQVGGYIALVDLGMSGFVSRLLVDVKDQRVGGDYGSLIKTGILVGVAQGILVLFVGGGLAALAGGWLHVHPDLAREFTWLMIGQSVLLALGFASRILTHILTAHQRIEVINYSQIIALTGNFLIFWISFASGAGIYSMLWAQLAGWLVANTLLLVRCARLHLFPKASERGRLSLARFKELFWFGQDMFLFAVGSQLVNATQAILLTRWLGLEAASVWSVCIRMFTLLTQVLYRIFDFSAAALAEMIVRNERDRLAARFRQVAVVSVNLAVCAGAIFAAANGAFIRLWTAGKMGWPVANDILLAGWLVVCVAVHSHVGLVGQTKKFLFLRWIYFFEGLAFVCLAAPLTHWRGITGMLVASLLCSCLFTLPYGLWRTRNYFHLSWRELAAWHHGTWRLLLWLAPAVAAVLLLQSYLPTPARFGVAVVFLGGLGLWGFLRYGLTRALLAELAQKLPAAIGRLLGNRLRDTR